ncbi:WD40 repeat domain-containing protein [Streptomyces sp. NPDC059649]|uniref:WD40 repeat domain-containing protein n=1 Tax=Streptomyces sp. NPDC059649 TaxID=3346895 RepID=UPI0036B8EA37
MTDDRMMTRFAGHTHAGHDTTPVMEVDGVPVTISVDSDATLWVCDLLGGACVSRRLDLDAAGPEDEWYYEVGEWDEEDDEEDVEAEAEEGDEDAIRPRCEVDAYEIASQLTVAHLDGRPVVVTGGGRFDLSGPELETMGGAVRVWDLRTGRKIGKTLTGHGLGVTSLTTVATDLGLLAVSSSEEGELRAWNVTSGERVAALQASYNGGMGAGLIAGRPIAVTGGHDDFVQVWDLLSGEQLGQSLTGIKPAVRALATVEVEGRTVVAAGGDDHVLHLWDLKSGEPLGAPLTGHTQCIATMGTARIAGRAIAVTGSNDGTSRIWDLARGEQLGDPLPGHLQTVTELSGAPVAVTHARDAGIRVWDLTRAVR